MSQHDQNQTSNETGTRTSVAWLPYIETLVVLGIMVGVNLLWFEDHWGYLDKKPHLFWIVVVLIPLQYGLVVGIFSGLAASAGHVLFQATQDSPHYSFDFSDISYTVPVLMVLAAVVVGEGRQRGLSRYREVTERSKSLERAVEDLATQYTESEEAKALLQRRILTQTSTFTSCMRSPGNWRLWRSRRYLLRRPRLPPASWKRI